MTFAHIHTQTFFILPPFSCLRALFNFLVRRYVMPRFFFIFSTHHFERIMASDLNLTKYTETNRKAKSRHKASSRDDVLDSLA